MHLPHLCSLTLRYSDERNRKEIAAAIKKFIRRLVLHSPLEELWIFTDRWILPRKADDLVGHLIRKHGETLYHATRTALRLQDEPQESL